MALGGGFFRRDALADNFVRSETYTLVQEFAAAAGRPALLPRRRYRQIWPGAALRFQAALYLVAAAP